MSILMNPDLGLARWKAAVRLAAVLTASALAFAGCSPDAGGRDSTAATVAGPEAATSPPALTEPPGLAPVEATSDHTPTASPTPGPDVPAELTDPSDAGAKAAAAYFGVLMVETQLSMDTTRWRLYTAEHCWTCSEVVERVESAIAAGDRVVGGPASLRGTPEIVGRDGVVGLIAVTVPLHFEDIDRVDPAGGRTVIETATDGWSFEAQMAFGANGWTLVNAQLHNPPRSVTADTIRVRSLTPPVPPSVYDESEAVETASRFLEALVAAHLGGDLSAARDLAAATCWNCNGTVDMIRRVRDRGETVTGDGFTLHDGAAVHSRLPAIDLVVVKVPGRIAPTERRSAEGEVVGGGEAMEGDFLVSLRHCDEGWFVTEYWLDGAA